MRVCKYTMVLFVYPIVSLRSKGFWWKKLGFSGCYWKLKKKNWDILVSPVQNLLELLQVIILLHWVSSVNSTDSYLVTLPVPVHYLSRSPWHFERKLIRLCEVKSEKRSIRIFMNPSKNLLGFLFLAILDLTSGEGQFLASFLWMKKVFIRHSNSRCWMSLLNQW